MMTNEPSETYLQILHVYCLQVNIYNHDNSAEL